MLVSIPYKKTEKVDLAKPLNRYIQTAYDADTANRYLSDLNEFNSARENMRTAFERFPNEPSKVYDAIAAYLPWASSFALRFPHTSNDVKKIKNKKKKQTQHIQHIHYTFFHSPPSLYALFYFIFPPSLINK